MMVGSSPTSSPHDHYFSVPTPSIILPPPARWIWIRRDATPSQSFHQLLLPPATPSQSSHQHLLPPDATPSTIIPHPILPQLFSHQHLLPPDATPSTIIPHPILPQLFSHQHHGSDAHAAAQHCRNGRRGPRPGRPVRNCPPQTKARRSRAQRRRPHVRNGHFGAGRGTPRADRGPDQNGAAEDGREARHSHRASVENIRPRALVQN